MSKRRQSLLWHLLRMPAMKALAYSAMESFYHKKQKYATDWRIFFTRVNF
jgi:hypothetical protein